MLCQSQGWKPLSSPSAQTCYGWFRPQPQRRITRALSLEDCQAIARQQNPVLAGSREKVQELVADYQAARSKFFPRLVLKSYYDRDSHPTGSLRRATLPAR